MYYPPRPLAPESRILRVAVFPIPIAAVILYWLRHYVPQPWIAISYTFEDVRALVMDRCCFQYHGRWFYSMGWHVLSIAYALVNESVLASIVSAAALTVGVAVALALDALSVYLARAGI